MSILPLEDRMLIDGAVSNVRGSAFDCWLDAWVDLHQAQVQIYSTDYPVAETGVQRVLPYQLQTLAEEIQKRIELAVHAYWI